MNVDDLKREIKRLEQELEHKLNAYSNFSERVEQEAELSENEVSFSNHEFNDEISSLLRKLGDFNSQLGITQASVSIVQHHRSRLDDYHQNFRRLSKQVSQSIERTQLLGSSKSTEKSKEHSINMEMLIRERNSVHNSTNMADDLLNQARATKERLDHQKESLLGSESKIKSASSQLPDIFNLMGQIRWRKYKNNIILASVIAMCICFLIWYWMKT